jgi:4-methylaminobutanoate oxidase (formaldehyde-forming)
MGPRSRELLQSLTAADLSTTGFPFATSRMIDLLGVPVRATRITYVGELGYELLLPTRDALQVYDTLAAAGEPHGLRLAGYHAMNSLRIEKAYRHWGHDITPDESPLEAGLGFCIAWDKPAGFIGREALLGRKGQPMQSRLMQFLLEEADALLYHDEPIWRDGRRIGRVSSGMFGHTLGGAVGLGYVNLDRPSPQEEFMAGRYEIEVAGRRIGAKASLRPLYDPQSLRIRT